MQGESRRQRLASRRRRNTRLALRPSPCSPSAPPRPCSRSRSGRLAGDNIAAADGCHRPGRRAPQTPRREQTALARALDHSHPIAAVGRWRFTGRFVRARAGRSGWRDRHCQDPRRLPRSSGLWSNDIRNWSQRADEQMAERRPRSGRVHRRRQRCVGREQGRLEQRWGSRTGRRSTAPRSTR